MQAISPIDPADRLRLEAAVVEASRHTAGEIAVTVVESCDDYTGAGWRAGVLLAGLVFLGLAVARPGLAPWVLLGAQALALAVGHAACRVPAIRRRFVSDSARAARVADRAHRAFCESGLGRIPGRAGILIFAAAFERTVVVRADRGIHQALDPGQGWAEVAETAASGMERGEPTEGLLAAVERCGSILAEHLPMEAREPIALPAAVVVENRAIP